MKIIVPQELQQEIVKLYNQGINRKKIKQQLQLPFDDSAIKRILLENNCEIRGAQKDGQKEEIDIEVQKKIIDLYKQGYGLNNISKQMEGLFCADKVKRVLKDSGVQLRDFAEATQVKPEQDLRKYKINDDYELNSHNGAWLLGFLAADGYLPKTKGAKNRVTITLARQDEDILYQIKEELDYEGPIYQFDVAGGYPASSLAFTSQKLREKIESYGIVSNKTFQFKTLPKNLSDEYMIDFIRGFFDGDGSVYVTKDKKVEMSLACANKELLIDIREYLANKYNVAIPTLHSCIRTHEIFDIQYYKKDTLLLGDAFYNNSYLSLPRKKKHFFEIKEKYPLLRHSLPRD